MQSTTPLCDRFEDDEYSSKNVLGMVDEITLVQVNFNFEIRLHACFMYTHIFIGNDELISRISHTYNLRKNNN